MAVSRDDDVGKRVETPASIRASRRLVMDFDNFPHLKSRNFRQKMRDNLPQLRDIARIVTAATIVFSAAK